MKIQRFVHLLVFVSLVGLLTVGLPVTSETEFSPNTGDDIKTDNTNTLSEFINTVPGKIGVDNLGIDQSQKVSQSIATFNYAVGGNGTDYTVFRDIAYGADGSIYLLGDTNETSFPTTANALDETLNVDNTGKVTTDLFLVKISDQSVAFSTFIGGNNDDTATQLKITTSEDIIIAGETGSPDFPIPQTGWNSTKDEALGAFVIRVNTNGSQIVDGTFFGGSETDKVNYLSIGSDNNIYIAGSTYSDNLPIRNDTYQTFLTGSSEGYVAGFNANLTSLQFVTYYGGEFHDTVEFVEENQDGSLSIYGRTNSSELLSSTLLDFNSTAEMSYYYAQLFDNGELGFTTYISTNTSIHDPHAVMHKGIFYFGFELTENSDLPKINPLERAPATTAGNVYILGIDYIAGEFAFGSPWGSTEFSEDIYGLDVSDTGVLHIMTTVYSDSDFPLKNSLSLNRLQAYGITKVVLSDYTVDQATQLLPVDPFTLIEKIIVVDTDTILVGGFSTNYRGFLDYDSIIDVPDDTSESKMTPFVSEVFIPEDDGDGVPYPYEVENGMDPTVDDANGDIDGDGLTNLEEYNIGTLANTADTDGDGMPDGFEVNNGLDPLKDDAEQDLDGDGFSNIEEYFAETDPNDASDYPGALNASDDQTGFIEENGLIIGIGIGVAVVGLAAAAQAGIIGGGTAKGAGKISAKAAKSMKSTQSGGTQLSPQVLTKKLLDILEDLDVGVYQLTIDNISEVDLNDLNVNLKVPKLGRLLGSFDQITDSRLPGNKKVVRRAVIMTIKGSPSSLLGFTTNEILNQFEVEKNEQRNINIVDNQPDGLVSTSFHKIISVQNVVSLFRGFAEMPIKLDNIISYISETMVDASKEVITDAVKKKAKEVLLSTWEVNFIALPRINNQTGRFLLGISKDKNSEVIDVVTNGRVHTEEEIRSSMSEFDKGIKQSQSNYFIEPTEGIDELTISFQEYAIKFPSKEVDLYVVTNERAIKLDQDANEMEIGDTKISLIWRRQKGKQLQDELLDLSDHKEKDT